ncbi:MAG: PorP/SprF family type IX secretion system membrane protein [Bacteroidales bacterium]
MKKCIPSFTYEVNKHKHCGLLIQYGSLMKKTYSGVLKHRSCLYSLITCLCICITITSKVIAQESGLPVTQYMLNTLSYNPGFAGLSNGICLSLLHRQQWLGLGKAADGSHLSPNSTLLLIDAPIKAIKGGLGLEIASNNIAYFRDITIKVGYAYHLQTSIGKIGLGVQAVLMDKNLDFTKLKPENMGDVVLANKGKESAFLGDIAVGAYLQGNQGYFVGVSVGQIIAHPNDKIAFKPARTLTLSGGYSFNFPSLPKVEFTPTTYLSTDFTSVTWDITALATFNKKFWVGLSYRLQDAVSVLAGMNISRFRIGVSYDIPASKFASKTCGGFEVFVKYCFSLEGDKLNTEYKNARYL